jgi:hypothetical protein
LKFCDASNVLAGLALMAQNRRDHDSIKMEGASEAPAYITLAYARKMAGTTVNR